MEDLIIGRIVKNIIETLLEFVESNIFTKVLFLFPCYILIFFLVLMALPFIAIEAVICVIFVFLKTFFEVLGEILSNPLLWSFIVFIVIIA